ncbi:hypothetical protein ACPA9J_08220 [Pseudomonas aeruginosa]
MAELEPEQAARNWPRVAKCQARTQERVAELAGKLETAGAWRRSAWPGSGEGRRRRCSPAAGWPASSRSPGPLECLLATSLPARTATSARRTPSRPGCTNAACAEAQDHFYWLEAERPAKAGPTKSWIIC